MKLQIHLVTVYMVSSYRQRCCEEGLDDLPSGFASWCLVVCRCLLEESFPVYRHTCETDKRELLWGRNLGSWSQTCHQISLWCASRCPRGQGEWIASIRPHGGLCHCGCRPSLPWDTLQTSGKIFHDVRSVCWEDVSSACRGLLQLHAVSSNNRKVVHRFEAFALQVSYDPGQVFLIAWPFPAHCHKLCTSLRDHIGKHAWEAIEAEISDHQQR